MSNIVVKVSYSNKEDYRIMHAKALERGRAIKTCTFSVGKKRNEEEAYEAAVEAARELGETYEVTPEIPSLQALKDHLQKRTGSTGSDTDKPQLDHPLIEKFNNLGRFRAMIKLAVKQHGLEKVKDALTTGLEYVAEAEEEVAREQRVVSEANRKIAEAILSARKSGVSMKAPNEEVESWIERLSRTTTTAAKGEVPSGVYEYNGEQWQGDGHMPASFTRYLKESDSHSLEDLRVV
ncbi:hypothetical protein [Marinimicrobium sp. ABcell2]|uniref:hypothetical protein n=1 Tax=Marinimicrobium sp. ABcell2 TaxID=3069751 RepID=UPI0027B04D8C|nr:hypothetical protein [Marinimicrobium sp. ABcell2]MDQ2077367.1 hypothetical protein [Marinimicrobium sp. ABcell2]